MATNVGFQSAAGTSVGEAKGGGRLGTGEEADVVDERRLGPGEEGVDVVDERRPVDAVFEV